MQQEAPGSGTLLNVKRHSFEVNILMSVKRRNIGAIDRPEVR